MGNFSSKLANIFGGKKNPGEPDAVRAPSPGKGKPSLRDKMVASPPPPPPPVAPGPAMVPPPVVKANAGKVGTERIDYASAVRRQGHGGVAGAMPPVPPMPAPPVPRPAAPVAPPVGSSGVPALSRGSSVASGTFGVPPVPSAPPLSTGSGLVPAPVAPPRPIGGMGERGLVPVKGGGTVGGGMVLAEEPSGGEKVRPPWMSGGRKTQTLKPLPPREARPSSGAPQASHPPAWVAGAGSAPRSAPPIPVPPPRMVIPEPARELHAPEAPRAMGSPVAAIAEPKAEAPMPVAPPVASSVQPQGPPVAKIPPNFRFRELPVLDAGVELPEVVPQVPAPVPAPLPAKLPQPRVPSQSAVGPIPVAPPVAVKPPVAGMVPAPVDAPVAPKTTEVVSAGGGTPRGVALPARAPAASGTGAGPVAGRKVPGNVAGGVAGRKGIGQPIVAPAQGAQGGAGAPTSLASRRRGSRLWSSLFLLVLLGAGGAAGYFYWMQTRETRLVCQPMLDGYKISEKAYLMNPLVAEVERLHQRYLEQLEPLRQEQARREQAMAAAEKLAKEAEAPVAAAKQALAALEMKHKQEAVGLNAQGQEQFEARFKALEAELANTRQSFQQAVADRARRIRIEFAEDPAETEPDIVVSRFRTGLYGAGVGVDRKAEQAWAEEQLVQWRGYFEYWKSQRAALQEQFKASQGQFGGILEKQKAEAEQARAAIAKAEQQLKVAQEGANAARKAMGAGGFDPKSIEAELVGQMDALPEKFKLAESGDRADGKFVFSKLELNPNTPPGKFVVFFRAWKDDKEHWAFAEAEVVRLQETSIRVFPEILLEKRRMLIEGKFEPE